MEKGINIGTGACAAAILIFAFHIRVPEVMGTFVDSVGNAAVPLSMMTVGIMVAQSDLRELVTDKKQLVLSAIRLLVIPAICIPLMKLLPVDPVSYGIFILLMAMASGQCGDDGGKGVWHNGREYFSQEHCAYLGAVGGDDSVGDVSGVSGTLFRFRYSRGDIPVFFLNI